MLVGLLSWILCLLLCVLVGVGILLNFHLLKIRVRYAQNSILLYKVFGQWASSYVGWTYGGIESVRTMSLIC
jgi:hypothetical protein